MSATGERLPKSIFAILVFVLSKGELGLMLSFFFSAEFGVRRGLRMSASFAGLWSVAGAMVTVGVEVCKCACEPVADAGVTGALVP